MNDAALCIHRNTWGGGRSLSALALFSALAVTVGRADTASADFIIDTTNGGNGSSAFNGFGESRAPTVGQTFTLNQDRVLQDFTFFAIDRPGSAAVNFKGFVMSWDGNKATGPILFQSSAPRSTLGDQGSGGFQEITINTGGLALAGGGNEYVAFFSALNLFDLIDDYSELGMASNVYNEGKLVFSNENNFGALTTEIWPTSFSLQNGEDLAFRMRFAPAAVPEPGSLVLLGTGLASLWGYGWRRRKQTPTIAA